MTPARPGSLLMRIPVFLGLLGVAVFVALSLSTNAATRFYQWPWFFYWQLLLVTPIALLAGQLLAGRRDVRRFGGWLDSGLVLLAAVNVAAALLSPFRPQSLNAALIPVAAVSLAYLELNWIERDAVQRAARITLLAQLMGVLMFFFTLVSLGRWLLTHVYPAWAAGRSLGDALTIRNADPLGHSVYTAGFAVLAAPWLAVLGLATHGWRRKFWLVAAALALALVPSAYSRGGVLALIVALACAAALWLAQSSLSRAGRLLVTAGVLLAAAMLVGLDPRLRGLVLNQRWSAIASESNHQRSAMIEAGWLMGRDRWWTGYGPGTVSLVYPRYRARLSGGVDDVLQLHNTPVQFWAELGAPGVLALGLLLLGAAKLGCDAWRQRVRPVTVSADRLRVQAVLVAFTGYAVMCLVDYQLDVPLFAVVVTALLVLWRADTVEDGAGFTVTPSNARLAGGALLAALAIIMWPTLPNLRARQLFADAATARESGRPDVFVAGTEKAAAVASWDAFYPVQLGAFYGEQYLLAGDPAAQARARQLCAASLNHALAINPDQEYCHFNLGWLLLPEDPAAAEPHFRAAVRLVPDKGGVYLGLGLSLLARDEKSAAIGAFALEWLNDPQAVASPLWTLPPLAALRGDVAAALHREIAYQLKQIGLPATTGRQLRYVAALTDWWLGATPDMATLSGEGPSEPRWFFENLRLIDQRTYVPRKIGEGLPWEQLYAAWRDATTLSAAPGDAPELVGAINRRLLRERDSFTRLLVSPPGDEPSLEQSFRRQRLAYNVLLRNQDGFLLSDLYVFPENRLVRKYASFLFPSKGYLPGRVLLDSLDRLAPAPR
jgi:O-antigen ligase/tetratricopeptide (TPR) repeat protein